jgi:FixJ family two-component response regulator
MSNELTVFIVDDDPAVRDALGLLLSIKGYRTAVFASGEDFLRAWRPEWIGCLLLDVRMSGLDGLAVQKKLGELHSHLPIIIITGHADVSLARQAFKAQAADFLEKPLDDVKLFGAIEEAFSHAGAAQAEFQHREHTRRLLQNLTPRERQVLDLIVTGQHNRNIAPALDISVRTVEVHKARIMSKLGVDNVADLVRISMLHKART